MMFIELFAPKGALSAEQRRQVSERLVTELVSAEGAPADMIERGRAMSWLVIHEPEVWTVGGRQVDPAEAPRYVVRLNVPAGHFHEGMRAEVVTRVTRTLAAIDDDPQRLYQEPRAWVHINEIPDGNAGMFGQMTSLSDITRLIVKDERPQTDRPANEPQVDTVIDPICGMTVVLNDEAITLEHDGTTYGFCATSCRDIFAEQHGIPIAQ